MEDRPAWESPGGESISTDDTSTTGQEDRTEDRVVSWKPWDGRVSRRKNIKKTEAGGEGLTQLCLHVRAN